MIKNTLKTITSLNITSYNVYSRRCLAVTVKGSSLIRRRAPCHTTVAGRSIQPTLKAALMQIFHLRVLHFQLFQTKSQLPGQVLKLARLLSPFARPYHSVFCDDYRLRLALHTGILQAGNLILCLWSPLSGRNIEQKNTWQPASYLGIFNITLDCEKNNKFIDIGTFFKNLSIKSHLIIKSALSFTRPAVSKQPASQCGRVAFLKLAAGLGLAR